MHAKAPANRTFLFDIAHRPTTVNPPPTPSSGAAGALAAAPLVPAWKLGGPVARAPDHKTLDPTAASSSSSAASTTATTTRNEDQRGPPENQVALSVNSCRSAGAEFYGAWRLLWPKSALDATGTVGRVWKVRDLLRVEYVCTIARISAFVDDRFFMVVIFLCWLISFFI